jgi:hypothetical protein
VTQREFNLSLMPGVERPLSLAKEALDKVDETLFQDWAKQFTKLPEAMLREQWLLRLR